MTTQQAIEALHALPRMGQENRAWPGCRTCATTWTTRKRNCSASTLQAPTAREAWRP